MDTSQLQTVDTGKRFWQNSGSGRWATERMLAGMREGKPMSPALLRTNDTLRKDEWKVFDDAVVEEAVTRYRVVADLFAAGLTKPIPNAMGKTVFEYTNIGDMNPAIVSLDGMSRSENDRIEFGTGALPIPITHKDFFLPLRQLEASRNGGDGLDVIQARVSARKVAEELERMTVLGGKTFGGLPIYGMLTHPNRNTVSFGTNGNWAQVAKTGANMRDDVITMMGRADADKFYGPFVLYIPRAYRFVLEKEYAPSTGSDTTIRQRLLQIDGLSDVRVSDMLPADNMVLLQLSPDVIQMLVGETIQTVQWDIEGGMGINFKVFQIIVPLVRTSTSGNSGIVHMA